MCDGSLRRILGAVEQPLPLLQMAVVNGCLLGTLLNTASINWTERLLFKLV